MKRRKWWKILVGFFIIISILLFAVIPIRGIDRNKEKSSIQVEEDWLPEIRVIAAGFLFWDYKSELTDITVERDKIIYKIYQEELTREEHNIQSHDGYLETNQLDYYIERTSKTVENCSGIEFGKMSYEMPVFLGDTEEIKKINTIMEEQRDRFWEGEDYFFKCIEAIVDRGENTFFNKVYTVITYNEQNVLCILQKRDCIENYEVDDFDFMVFPGGIYILFDKYEIGPGAAGAPCMMLPIEPRWRKDKEEE